VETSFAARFAQAVIRCRWLIIILTLMLVGFAASGARFLQPTNDYRVFFADKNPQLHAFEAMQDTYDQSDNVLMVISPKDGKVFTKETLESIKWMTNEAWQTPFSTRHLFAN